MRALKRRKTATRGQWRLITAIIVSIVLFQERRILPVFDTTSGRRLAPLISENPFSEASSSEGDDDSILSICLQSFSGGFAQSRV